MRHVRALMEKPGYSRHFQIDSPFTDIPHPSFSFVGAAKAPLRLLRCQLSYTVTVPILCPYMMEAIGSCRVEFKVEDPISTGGATPASSHAYMRKPILGDKFTFTVCIDTVKGLSSTDFASVHAQIRLSSLVGASIASDDIFASSPVDMNTMAHILLKRKISVIITPDVVAHMGSSYTTIEFFAQVRHSYLDRPERWDYNRELSSPLSTQRPGSAKPAMRRCETDFIGPEQHVVLASIEIRELAPSGEYSPAEVCENTFQLRQGLQRRLHITLTHSSGKSLPWTGIEHGSIGDIRVVDKGRITAVTSPAVEMRSTSQDVEYLADGTCRLHVSGIWDSAAHGCVHLDRCTNQQVLVRLVMLVQMETLGEPAIFELDLPIKILGRDTKRSTLFTVWNSSKTFHSITAIFALHLAPPLARSARDLWRLDTAKKHVRGEEGLLDWRPRGLSLLEDFERLRRSERALADVQTTKVVLELFGEVEKSDSNAEKQGAILRRCVDLWKKEMETQHKVRLEALLHC